MKKKSLLISTKHHKELSKLSEAFGTSYYKLVEGMILYFKKTGINPNDFKNDNPSILVKNLDNKLIAFLKVQERDILKPLRLEVYNYSQSVEASNKRLVANLNKALSAIQENDKRRYEKLDLEFKKQRKALVAIAQIIDKQDKRGLISKISQILD